MADDRRKKTTIALSIAITGNSLFFQSLKNNNKRRKRSKVIKIMNYAEDVVPRQRFDQFKSHFRLTRNTFKVLLELLFKKIGNNDICQRGNLTILPEKQLLIAIWILANQESFRSVSDRFGVAKSAARNCLLRVVDAIIHLNNEEAILIWPNQLQMPLIVANFERKYGFPGVIGAIDGTHINIKRPIVSPASYLNRKGNYSIILQAVCTDDLLFTNCYAGEVGSVHDACVYRRSGLFSQKERDPGMFMEYHLIGDPAYPLEMGLMVAFRDNGRLGQRERLFNRTLSSARCTIERAFAHLKGRFRRLKYLDMSRVDLIPYVIMASCILHNLCIKKGDYIDIDEPNPLEREENVMAIHQNRAAAVNKRDNISHQLLEL